jgi:hypothetical protein
MLNSATLDVVIGLAIVFLIMSTIVSSINELISAALKLRATSLRSALDSLLGPGLADKVIEHPTVPAAPSTGPKQPSYIEPTYFAVALLDVVGGNAANPNAPMQERIKAALDSVDHGPTKKMLASFVNHSGGDYGTLVSSVAGWFDAYMDRVGGTYKRRSQTLALVVAVLVVGILDVDALKIYKHLSAQPAFAASLAAKADTYIAQARTQIGAEKAGDTLGQQTSTINAEIGSLPVAIGWHPDDLKSPFEKIIGLIITIIAASLGAPFWFDALSKLSNLRSSGTKPDPTPPPKAPATLPAPPPHAPALGPEHETPPVAASHV